MRLVLVRSVSAETISAQFHIERLPAQSQHFRRRAPVFAGEFERCLNAEALDQVGRLADKFSWALAHEFGELLDGAGKFAPAELFAPASPSF